MHSDTLAESVWSALVGSIKAALVAFAMVAGLCLFAVVALSINRPELCGKLRQAPSAVCHVINGSRP